MFLVLLLSPGMTAMLVMWPGPSEQIFIPALHKIWLQLAQWLLGRCLKLSYYESPGSTVRE